VGLLQILRFLIFRIPDGLDYTQKKKKKKKKQTNIFSADGFFMAFPDSTSAKSCCSNPTRAVRPTQNATLFVLASNNATHRALLTSTLLTTVSIHSPQLNRCYLAAVM
jgi:hypothetical protein